ncbi:MAG TPA: hypothetical protein VLG69_02480 [Candidatus Andersenbacteria bacterium]|nr:hypothetical protein [Candidatus Andersenbacteria bacterium]
MQPFFSFFTRAIAGLLLLSSLVLFTHSANASNPIHTNCSGTQCTIDAIWFIFLDSLAQHFQYSVTSMNMDTALVQAGIVNQSNTKSSFLPGATLTVPINASGELITTGGNFYDSPPVYFDAGGAFRAIMKNVASCTFVESTLQSSFSAFRSNICDSNGNLDNSPLTGSWEDSWTTSAGTKLQCATNADGKTATCISATSLAPGSQTITLTRTVKNLEWSAEDRWLKKSGIPTLNLHPFWLNYAYLVSGWDTLHDAPMVSSATVNFVEKKVPTVDLTVGPAAVGPFTDGPITILRNTNAYLHWTSTNATSCAMTGGLTASNLPATGLNYPTGNLANASTTFTITCTGPGGVSNPDSVTVFTSTVLVTPSPSPSVSPSPVIETSPTPGVTPTPSTSPNVSPSPSVSPTPGVTPTPSTSPNVSPSPSPTPGFNTGNLKETR